MFQVDPERGNKEIYTSMMDMERFFQVNCKEGQIKLNEIYSTHMYAGDFFEQFLNYVMQAQKYSKKHKIK